MSRVPRNDLHEAEPSDVRDKVKPVVRIWRKLKKMQVWKQLTPEDHDVTSFRRKNDWLASSKDLNFEDGITTDSGYHSLGPDAQDDSYPRFTNFRDSYFRPRLLAEHKSPCDSSSLHTGHIAQHPESFSIRSHPMYPLYVDVDHLKTTIRLPNLDEAASSPDPALVLVPHDVRSPTCISLPSRRSTDSTHVSPRRETESDVPMQMDLSSVGWLQVARAMDPLTPDDGVDSAASDTENSGSASGSVASETDIMDDLYRSTLDVFLAWVNDYYMPRMIQQFTRRLHVINSSPLSTTCTTQDNVRSSDTSCNSSAAVSSLSSDSPAHKRRATSADDLSGSGSLSIGAASKRRCRANKKQTKLACHFYKLDADKFSSGRYKSCRNGYDGLNRLKDHQKYVHRPSHYCRRCKLLFRTQDELDSHHDQDQPCHRREDAAFDDLLTTDAQRAILTRKKPVKTTDEAFWFEMWDTYFPGKRRPASAYQDVNPMLTALQQHAERDPLNTVRSYRAQNPANDVTDEELVQFLLFSISHIINDFSSQLEAGALNYEFTREGIPLDATRDIEGHDDAETESEQQLTEPVLIGQFIDTTVDISSSSALTLVSSPNQMVHLSTRAPETGGPSQNDVIPQVYLDPIARSLSRPEQQQPSDSILQQTLPSTERSGDFFDFSLLSDFDKIMEWDPEMSDFIDPSVDQISG